MGKLGLNYFLFKAVFLELFFYDSNVHLKSMTVCTKRLEIPTSAGKLNKVVCFEKLAKAAVVQATTDLYWSLCFVSLFNSMY